MDLPTNINELKEYSRTHILTDEEAVSLVETIKSLPAEQGTELFLAAANVNENMLAIHPLMREFLTTLLPEMQKINSKQ